MRKILLVFAVLLTASCTNSYIGRDKAIETALFLATHPNHGPAFTGSEQPKIVLAELITYAAARERLGEGSQY